MTAQRLSGTQARASLLQRIGTGLLLLLIAGATEPACAATPGWQPFAYTTGTLTSGAMCRSDGFFVICDSNAPTYDATNLRIGISSSTPVASIDLSQRSDAIAVPRGNTAARPVTGVINGMIRYNTDTNLVESYQGGGWSAFSGAALASGTAGAIQFSVGSTIGNNRANFFWDNTNLRLGIGTAGPIEPLETYAATNGEISNQVYNNSTGASTQARFTLSTGTPNSYVISSLADNSGSPSYLMSAGSGVLSAVWQLPSYNFQTVSGTIELYISGGSIGIGTTGPAGVLDVTSTSSAFLPPRMTTTQRNAITSPIAGMMIYNSTNGEVEVYNGTAWAGIGSNIMNGAIAAFASSTCPTGWTEYTTARGAFLRGIDNGAGLDPSGTRAAGNYEADTFASHTHTITDPGHSHGITDPGHTHGSTDYLWRNDSNPYHATGGLNGHIRDSADGYGQGINDRALNIQSHTTGITINGATTGITIASTGGSETRPKNIAVTFCQFNGAGAAPTAISLASLSGVNISSPAAGQFLGYNGTAWVNTAGLTVASTGSVGIGTTGPNYPLDVNGVINGANVNQAPIQSTKTSSSRAAITGDGNWHYTGEYITITVPAGPNRSYRIGMRQMGNDPTGGAANLYSLSTSTSTYTGTPAGMGFIYYTSIAGYWQQGYTEGYVTLAPGTYTYYVMANSSGGTVSVANSTADGANYCNVQAWAM